MLNTWCHNFITYIIGSVILCFCFVLPIIPNFLNEIIGIKPGKVDSLILLILIDFIDSIVIQATFSPLRKYYFEFHSNKKKCLRSSDVTFCFARHDYLSVFIVSYYSSDEKKFQVWQFFTEFWLTHRFQMYYTDKFCGLFLNAEVRCIAK